METTRTKFEYDKDGNFRICVNDRWSHWTPYAGIAHVKFDDGPEYLGMSPYWDSVNMGECIMLVDRIQIGV